MKQLKKITTLLFVLALITTFVLPTTRANAEIIPYFNMTNQRTNMQLHVDANNHLKLWNDTYNTSNIWYMVKIWDSAKETNYYGFVNLRTNLQLHMDANNNVVLWNDIANPSNEWKIQYRSEYAVITNKRTGLQLHCDANNNLVGWSDFNNPSNGWNINSLYFGEYNQ